MLWAPRAFMLRSREVPEELCSWLWSWCRATAWRRLWAASWSAVWCHASWTGSSTETPTARGRAAPRTRSRLVLATAWHATSHEPTESLQSRIWGTSTYRHYTGQGPVLQTARLAWSRIKSKLSCQFVCEYETESLPKCLNYNAENNSNGPSFSSFKLVQVAGSEIEMKNFTYPGLA